MVGLSEVKKRGPRGIRSGSTAPERPLARNSGSDDPAEPGAKLGRCSPGVDLLRLSGPWHVVPGQMITTAGPGPVAGGAAKDANPQPNAASRNAPYAATKSGSW